MPDPKRSGPGRGAAPESSAVAGRHHEDTSSSVPFAEPVPSTDPRIRFARRAGCVCPHPVKVRLRQDLSTAEFLKHDTPGCPLYLAAPTNDGGAA